MRAVVVDSYAPIDLVGIATIPAPDPGPREVRVRVAAAGVGFVDGLKVQGLYQTKDPLPFTPGMEFSGVVEALGPDVTGLAPGDRVFGMATRGALAEFIVVPAVNLHPVPDGVDLVAVAGALANPVTALYALEEIAAIQPGERLLVLGASGGTGSAAIQIGKLLGAHVIAAASTPGKRQFALDLGADAAFDYTAEGWRDEIKALTNGHGADVIFDGVGGDISPLAFRSLAWRGRHLVIGFAAGKIPALPFNIALLKGASLRGVDIAQVRAREPAIYAGVVAKLLAWLADGQLVASAGEVFAFEDFRAAFRAMAARDAKGKMIVRIA